MITIGVVLNLLATLQAQAELKHIYNVEPHFFCPQTFLSLDFQSSNDVSELK